MAAGAALNQAPARPLLQESETAHFAGRRAIAAVRRATGVGRPFRFGAGRKHFSNMSGPDWPRLERRRVRVMEAYGGSITGRSAGARGTTFELRFPKRAAPAR